MGVACRVPFHLGFSSGGGKRDNHRVKGGKDCTSVLSAKNNIVLVNWGVWGHATPGKVLHFLTAETVSGGF